MTHVVRGPELGRRPDAACPALVHHESMTIGNGDPSTRLGQLAEQHRAAGRLAEAVRALRQGVSAAHADLGDAHPTTARLRERLTDLLIELGRDGEAAELEARYSRCSRRGEGDGP